MDKIRVPVGPVCTVGQLREKIKDLPDDEAIYWQVVAEDGAAWSMGADMGTAPGGAIFCGVLRHPDLKTLAFADGDTQKVLEAAQKIRSVISALSDDIH